MSLRRPKRAVAPGLAEGENPEPSLRRSRGSGFGALRRPGTTKRRVGRRALILGLAAIGTTLLGGHTPYGQWVVYRKKHLLIGCHRADPTTFHWAQVLERELAANLPKASARAARAPDAGRLASLLGTDQMEVAILSAADARAIAEGAGAFAPYGAIPLRLLAPLGDRLLIAHADFPDDHARLVAGAVMHSAFGFHPPESYEPPLPWHPGAAALLGAE